MPSKLELVGLTKVYPGTTKPAVSDLSLTIDEGEFVVLVGPSGCGKSTTLRMIAGLESPTAGDIYLDGQRVTNLDPQKRLFSMVFQSYALYPHMTVRQNLEFPLKKLDLTVEEREERIFEAADMLEISALLERKPGELSGGQRQRVALGRAIVKRPKLFLFDEPLSNLDAKLRLHMRAEIKKLQSRLGTTAIYVTHDQVEAMSLGDRIVVMKDGVVQQVDEPLTIYRNPANQFVGGFLGSPPINFIDARLAEAGENAEQMLLVGDVRVPVPARYTTAVEGHTGPITVGVRPEDIELTAETPEQGELEGIVSVVEPVGSEWYVHVELAAGTTVVARVSTPLDRPVEGTKVTLAPKWERAVLFSSTTGAAL